MPCCTSRRRLQTWLLQTDTNTQPEGRSLIHSKVGGFQYSRITTGLKHPELTTSLQHPKLATSIEHSQQYKDESQVEAKVQGLGRQATCSANGRSGRLVEQSRVGLEKDEHDEIDELKMGILALGASFVSILDLGCYGSIREGGTGLPAS